MGDGLEADSIANRHNLVNHAYVMKPLQNPKRMGFGGLLGGTRGGAGKWLASWRGHGSSLPLPTHLALYLPHLSSLSYILS